MKKININLRKKFFYFKFKLNNYVLYYTKFILILYLKTINYKIMKLL